MKKKKPLKSVFSMIKSFNVNRISYFKIIFLNNFFPLIILHDIVLFCYIIKYERKKVL